MLLSLYVYVISIYIYNIYNFTYYLESVYYHHIYIYTQQTAAIRTHRQQREQTEQKTEKKIVVMIDNKRRGTFLCLAVHKISDMISTWKWETERDAPPVLLLLLVVIVSSWCFIRPSVSGSMRAREAKSLSKLPIFCKPTTLNTRSIFIF